MLQIRIPLSIEDYRARIMKTQNFSRDQQRRSKSIFARRLQGSLNQGENRKRHSIHINKSALLRFAPLLKSTYIRFDTR